MHDPDAALRPGMGLGGATITNVLTMIGVGPFITIPLLLQAMPGPQAMLGWLLGALVALGDGLVWAELGACFPRTGGGYHYLLEAYGRDRSGRLMSFLYLWSTVITGPFVLASGAIGFSQYATYLLPAMSGLEAKLLAAGACLVATALVYRRIDSVGRWATGFAVVVVGAVLWVTVEGVRHGHAANLAFAPHALAPTRALWSGLGAASLYALYDYSGYTAVCAIGGELVRPQKAIPRAIVLAIGLVAALYLSMNLAVIAAIPWREAAQSQFIASDLIARFDGPLAGVAITWLILITTMAGLFAGMFWLSRVPYAAAMDGRFFAVFAQVHPSGYFPRFSVAFTGVASAACCFLTLDEVIKAFTVIGILLASLPVVVAPTLVRLGAAQRHLPFRMWLYPLPSLIAGAGWLYIVATSGWVYILAGAASLLLGVGAYLVRARRQAEWPFSSKP